MQKYSISSLGDSLRMKTMYKAKFSTLYFSLFDYIYNNYEDSNAFRTKVVDVINNILYYLYSGDTFPESWDLERAPFDYEPVDDSDIEDMIGRDSFLYTDDIYWDINPKEGNKSIHVTKRDDDQNGKIDLPSFSITSSEDLYLRPPKFPMIDVDRFMTIESYSGIISKVYETLPKIPSKQSEISATTDVDSMKDRDLSKLYPNSVIKTRSKRMYQPCEGIELHPILGLILPIEGYTRDQLVDNLVKYPHFYKLKRLVGDPLVTEDYRCFYYDIEIDGDLIPILKAWDVLPESDVIPKDPEFVKEYVVRRYLLERDVLGIEHRFPMLGDLREHITISMPFDKYVEFGYDDSIELMRTCVSNRVNYIRSINPVFRHYGRCVDMDKCVFCGHCTRERCTAACPDLFQFSNLLDRNGISLSDSVFRQDEKLYKDYAKLLESRSGTVSTIVVKNPDPIANLLTYVGICLTWLGGSISNGVYHLRYSRYVEELQMSWGSDESEEFRLMKIRSNDSRLLIISQLDMVDFTNKISQSLYVLLKERKRKGLTTIVVSPNLNDLAGKGHFYSLLVKELKGMIR